MKTAKRTRLVILIYYLSHRISKKKYNPTNKEYRKLVLGELKP